MHQNDLEFTVPSKTRWYVLGKLCQIKLREGSVVVLHEVRKYKRWSPLVVGDDITWAYLWFRGFGGVSFLHPGEEVTEEAAASKSCLGNFSAGSFMLADNAVLPWKLPCPLKKLLGRRLFSFWNGPFFGDMPIFRGVTPKDVSGWPHLYKISEDVSPRCSIGDCGAGCSTGITASQCVARGMRAAWQRH